MFGLEFMERCPAQAAQEKPQLLIFLRPKDISENKITKLLDLKLPNYVLVPITQD